MKACRLVVVLALAFVFAVSCAPSPNRKVLGKWKRVDGNEIVQFSSDGKVKFIDEEAGTVVLGTFKFVGEEDVEIVLDGSPGMLAGLIEVEAEVEENELELSVEDGAEIEYERIVD